MPLTTAPRQWREIPETLKTNPFDLFADYFFKLNLTSEDAMIYFTIDFETALCKYTEVGILKIFDMVYHTNKIKYDKLVAAATAEYDPIQNYNMTEEGTDTRTPDLTHTLELNTTSAMTDTRQIETTGNSNTHATNKLNQTHTTLEKPNDYKETNVHSVNPEDNAGFADDEKSVITQSGTRSVEESYSGNADETDTNVDGSSTTTNSGGTSTTNTGTNTQTESGTDTTTHQLTRKGNIGVTTSQQMLESEIKLAEKMNVFKIIEQDLAAKLFLQVWI